MNLVGFVVAHPAMVPHLVVVPLVVVPPVMVPPCADDYHCLKRQSEVVC